MRKPFVFLMVLFALFLVTSSAYTQTCDYIPGDVNGSENFNGIDVVYCVAFFKGIATPPSPDCNPPCITYGDPPQPLADPFYAAGDVNDDCQFNGLDILYYCRNLKGVMPRLLYCPDCPPASRQ